MVEGKYLEPTAILDSDHMEYLTYHGTYADIPVDRILAAWHETYGRERVQAWIDAFEKADGRRLADFDREDVLKP